MNRPVTIKHMANGGRLEIIFKTLDDLDTLLAMFKDKALNPINSLIQCHALQ